MKPQPWKTLASKEILNHPRMHLIEDTVELPDGTTAEYLLQAPTDDFGVAVIAVNDKNEMLLQKEHSYPPNEVCGNYLEAAAKQARTLLRQQTANLAKSPDIGKSVELIGSYYYDNRRSNAKQYVVLAMT